jgi:NAD(P)-dependent dehydrogenase (short-subunit alcohol dehydrogenase family)
MSYGKTIALVTGANRGIGWQVARELAACPNTAVVVTATKQEDANQAAESIRSAGADVIGYALMFPSAQQVNALRDVVLGRFGRLDILINNAAVYLDNPLSNPGNSLLELDPDGLIRTFLVNVDGPLRLITAFLPAMKQENFGRIVNVSSGMGRIGDFDSSSPFYRLSKLCLNGLTRIVAHEVTGYNILVNAVCPGWVRTGMGGKRAPRSPEEGARGILWAARLPDTGPSGGFFRDGIALDWYHSPAMAD